MYRIIYPGANSDIYAIMAETTEFVSTIRVRDLISAFESKSDPIKVEFTRPRAKSVGNILPKNVLVRQNDFRTLDDIEKALRKLETGLNFYEVYNKAKHVEFQEQLFNILTSIVNIESSGEEDTARKKRLISKTQTLVSFLNQKLPSNVNQSVAPKNDYKYTTYSSYVKENGSEKPKSRAIYSENVKSIEIAGPGEEFTVSVKKLKENFQGKSSDQPDNETPEVTEEVIVEKKEEVEEHVSVSKLRNLFERKSEESSKGIGVITDENDQDNKLVFSNDSIPYTESNLSSVRLKRSVSGNYMNYVGLLNRVDLNKNSADLTKDDAAVVNAEARADDDDYKNDEQKNVHTLKSSYSTPNLGKSATRIDDATELSPGENVSIISNVEDIKVKYTTTIATGDSTPNTDTIEDFGSLKGYEEDIVPYSTTITTSGGNTEESEEQSIVTFQDTQEQEVNFSTAKSENVNDAEATAVIEGTGEVNVDFSTATLGPEHTAESTGDVSRYNGVRSLSKAQKTRVGKQVQRMPSTNVILRRI
ncbi:hypothetical protein NQ317_013434 [Molorchus minor]|uniref:Uncharacterized protein n=1 Tax=Molorchus minor TaxID=1323400 RepID=A0ABQ9JRS6_9CUCU|nr:hypothetical protein NQ317_013434 [Molorchus minor]